MAGSECIRLSRESTTEDHIQPQLAFCRVKVTRQAAEGRAAERELREAVRYSHSSCKLNILDPVGTSTRASTSAATSGDIIDRLSAGFYQWLCMHVFCSERAQEPPQIRSEHFSAQQTTAEGPRTPGEHREHAESPAGRRRM